jgi:hypothetical protein
MLYKEHLELAVLRGCSNPCCNHKRHSEVYLDSKCHAGGLSLSYPQPDVLRLACGQCNDKILEIAVAEQVSWRPKCHPTSAVWVLYKRKSGRLRVTCAKCDKLVTKIRLRRSEALPARSA